MSEKVPMEQDIDFAKVDAERNLVFGWASVAFDKDGEQVLDKHQDMIDIDELEDAAYFFNLEFRKTGEEHQGEALGHLVESMVITPDKIAVLAGDDASTLAVLQKSLPLGWWVGFYIDDDDVFAKVKAGEYEMFSIQGHGVREKVE